MNDEQIDWAESKAVGWAIVLGPLGALIVLAIATVLRG